MAEEKCKVMFGTFEVHPFGTSGRVMIKWSPNLDLDISKEGQYAHNKSVDPDFDYFVFKEV